MQQQVVIQASTRQGRKLAQSVPTALPAWARTIDGRDVIANRRPSRSRILTTMGNQMDMRRTYRAWARSGGTRVLWKRSTRYVAPRRIVILWDVSGSMREMIPLYVPWLHRLLFTVRDAVAFAFGVGVADVTQALRQSYPRAVEALQEIPDVWDGGTSIGIALQDWDDHFGSVTCRGRTTVLIISDGWDSGRPEDVRAALRKISSRGVRLLWMHPLLHSPGFALQTRALEAAKPFVDAWIPGGSVDELRQCRLT